MKNQFIRCIGQLLFLSSIIGVSPVHAQKESKEKIYRLPDDLETLVSGPALLEKSGGLAVAAYVFPNYHTLILYNKICSQDWTEYNLIHSACPWLEGHQQLYTSLLREFDEGKSFTWKAYNKLYKQSGVDVLIWGWYWYDGKPCLHEALENGFLEASNTKDVKLTYMWTNHPWYVLYPTKRTDKSNAYPPSFGTPDLSREEYWKNLSYMISCYCHLKNYWRIDDRPVICIWDARRLKSKLGTVRMKQLFAKLTNYAERLGHKGLYFHVAGFNYGDMEEEGYDTVGSYSPMDWVVGRSQPKEIELPDYEAVVAGVAFRLWDERYSQSDIPYVPAVASGWDSTPRYTAPVGRPAKVSHSQWPDCTISKNGNPVSFKAFVRSSFMYLSKRPEVPRILIIACFNERSGGHYLLPDNHFGYSMLDALEEALGKEGNYEKHGERLTKR